jgi:hypothetical protein
MAGLVPATPLNKARPCHLIGVAGTSPAMTTSSVTASNGYSDPLAASPEAHAR